MQFNRYFTAAHVDTDIWERRDAKILDSKGNITFEQKCVEVPKFWSDNALNIVASKYFKIINGKLENSIKNLIKRIVTVICTWGQQQNYFNTLLDRDIFEAELTYLLTYQYASFNSPIWFNFGTTGPHQAAACFLIGLEDTSESIRKWMDTESIIFKGGSGSGTNVSPLRPQGAPLSRGGTSSGPMPFVKASSENAGSWKSGGTTRRAAKLVCMNTDHKDIEKFITCKVKEEEKAQILIEAGYDPAIDGEAYGTVAYQNMNHSVRVTDEFMQKVINKDPEATKLITLMAECAHKSGDPGIQYDTTINAWHTIPNSGKINTTNPCSEYGNTDWSSCLLASFNLYNFRCNGSFDFYAFQNAVSIFTTALDIIIDGADYPDPKFKETAHNQRQIGLGYSNLGTLIMSMGSPYGSPEGREIAAGITSEMTATAYIQSALIAKDLGPFTDFEKNKYEMLHVVNMHREAAAKRWGDTHYFTQHWDQALELGTTYGYRNAVPTLIAPTGTISFMMDCDTTGVESAIALVAYKKLVGGGYLTLVHPIVRIALETLGYETTTIDLIMQHIKDTGTIEGSELKSEHLAIFDCSLKAEKGIRFIDYNDHVEMMAVIQPFLAMGISKTINMPSSATVQDILKVYIDSWKKGIKSISVYRDGSKGSQPLNVSKEKTNELKSKTVRKALPPERPAIIHKFDIGGMEGYLHVGLFDNGQPGELFITSSKLGSTMDGLLDAFATSTSFNLQYGVPLEFLIDKYTNTRFDPAGFTKNPDIKMATSIIDYIFRWMKLKFIDSIITINSVESTKSNLIKELAVETGQFCRCGSSLVKTGTCSTCPSCGESYGGCG